MSEKTNQLQVILNEQGLDEKGSKAMIEAFGGPFEEAGEILGTYKKIAVSDEYDIDGMSKAREARLTLKKARTTVENNRKTLKADILKQGKTIDAVAKFVKETIQPAEEYLQLQENFAKIQQEKREAEKKTKRLERLSGFEVDTSIYNIDLMTDEAFDSLIEKLESDAKRAEEERAAAEKKKLEEEETERKRQAEIQAENERLKKEAEEKEKANQIIRDRVNKVTALGLVWDDSKHVYQKALTLSYLSISPDQIKTLSDKEFDELFDVFTEAIGEELRIQKEKQDRDRAQAEADRIEKERLQKLENDRIAAEAEEKRIAAENERKSLLAPDKEKVAEFLQKLKSVAENHIPAVKDKEAFSILENVQRGINAIVETASEQVEKL